MDNECWLETRKKYITGTDVAKILNYYIYGSSSYYGSSIFRFTELKNNPPAISSWMSKKFSDGSLAEYQAFLYKQKKYGVDNCHRNRFFTNGIFSVTLDIEIFHGNKSWIEEVKTTASKKYYQEFASMEHFAYFQAAAQLYCTEHNEVHVKIIYTGKDEHLDNLTRIITRESWQYKSLIEHIDELQVIFETYMAGVEPFSNKGMNTKKLNSIPQNIKDEIIAIKHERERIQDSIANIKNREHSIIEALNRLKIRDFEIDEWIVSIVPLAKKVVKEKYKDAVHRVDLAVRNYKHNSLNDLRKQVGESLYEIPEEANYIRYSPINR